ncbi:MULTISPECIES: restriction endonuclease [unclassified Maridesulfovibrio]|uniref:restriction endonuclease n=1 Tax=unclassified Maridesulfovibrio TaxID=2794999 RepID=UPI003B3D12CC
MWDDIESGTREAVEIIYVAESPIDLDEIIEWGFMTGWWNIRVVDSVKSALYEQSSSPAEVMVLLGVDIDDVEIITEKFPHLPLSLANYGGFDYFPPGWPAQVVVAQWSVPRPTEFANGIADALSDENIELIYEATGSSNNDVGLITSVNEELWRKLAEYPEERFRLNPRVFEEAVAEILIKMGYDIQLTPQSGDNGVDIIANLATPAAPILMLVECKRYAPHRLVGPEPITRLWFRMFNDNANMAMVVTTSDFQPIAHQTAREKGYQISLKDGDNFIEWIRSLKNLK